MRKLILLTVAVLALVVFATGCSTGGNAKLDSQRKASVKERAQAFSRAESVAPTPKPTNFPLRKALVEFTERQDAVDHPWYVYLLGLNGNAVAYYVAKTVPINACDFLSSTEDLKHDDEHGGFAVVTAPSLDGIYYGGSGTSAGCDSWFFFDSATNALIQIRGVNWYAADQPLRVEAKPILVGKGK